METGKSRLLLALALCAALFSGSCSSSSGGSSLNPFVGASQSLTLDPSGQTVVFTFTSALSASLTPGNFEADGGQLATMVSISGPQATVVFDDRVTPSHQVRVVGVGGIVDDFHTVVTSNPTPPTFAVTAATQTVGLGGDTIDVQFSGVNVVQASAEDPAGWTLTVNGLDLDLTGGTFTFDPVLQTLNIVLPSAANLHATFELAATGIVSVADVALSTVPEAGVVGAPDVTAPGLLSVVQNLTADEFGLTVDFTFDEAMDPASSTLLGNYTSGGTVMATQVTQPMETVLRVTFSEPILPGIDTIDVVNVVDAHGVGYPDGNEAVASGGTVANSFAVGFPVVTTLPNFNGDTIVAEFVQAIDVDSAEDPARWVFESPVGTPVDITTSVFDYDLMAKTLTIRLDTDLLTVDTFRFAASGGTPPLDVDAEAFVGDVSGTNTGDGDVPTVLSVTQNRTADPDGLTYDVLFSEDVDAVNATNVASYTFSNGAMVNTAIQLGTLEIIRLEIDTLAVPGQHMLDVVGTIADLAGNSAVPGMKVIATTDSSDPAPSLTVVSTVSGTDNDTVEVVFDDQMIEAEVTNVANWMVQSPPGTMLDTSLASIAYDAPSRTATLTFDGGDGINFRTDDTYRLELITMRDIAGNVVDSSSILGTVVGDIEYPTLESVWVDGGSGAVQVRMSEPSDRFDDFPLTKYVLRDAMGLPVTVADPTVTPHLDGLGAQLTFSVGATPAHTLDMRGATDLAGNQMFAVEQHAIVAEDSGEAGLDIGIQTHLAVSGERNDSLTAVFDRPVSSWQLFESASWTLTDGMNAANFSNVEFEFDGDRTVTIVFNDAAGYDFSTGPYTLTVDEILTAQGILMTAPSVDTTVADVASDATTPLFGPGGVRLDAQDTVNSVLIEFDEAVEGTDAGTPANYMLNGATAPDSVLRLGQRTVRATFLGGVTLPATIDVTVEDLAGNSALANVAITTEDTSGPVVTLVQGNSVPGVGGDSIEVRYLRPVTTTSATDLDNFTVTVSGSPLDMDGSTLEYRSTPPRTLIHLPDTVDLADGATLNVMVDGISSHAGLMMSPPADALGTVSGDSVAPTMLDAFVNYRADPDGEVLDVLFSEDLSDTFFLTSGSFLTTSGLLDIGMEKVSSNHVRVTFPSTVPPGDMLDTDFLGDRAGNVSGALSILPKY